MYFNYLPVGNWHGQKKATKWNASAGTPRWGHHLTMISQFIPLKSLISLYLSSSLISSHYQSYIICKPILTSHDIIHIYIEREREWYSMYVCIYIYTLLHIVLYCINTVSYSIHSISIPYMIYVPMKLLSYTAWHSHDIRQPGLKTIPLLVTWKVAATCRYRSR